VRTHRDVEVPLPVRAAGVLVGLQGLASTVVAIVLLVRALGGGALAGLGLSEVVIFLIIAAAFAVPGVLLWLGRRGARNGAVFMQLLLLGGVWSQFSPAEWVALDLLITGWSAAVLVLLFLAPSRAWAVGPSDE
jgi:hypothetical protein